MLCKAVVLTISGESREVTCIFNKMLEKSSVYFSGIFSRILPRF